MTPAFTARRRAEEFDSLLEDTSTDVIDDARYAGLLMLVSTLREVPQVAPRSDFVATLRSRLMVAAETALAPDTAAQVAARRAPSPGRTPRERRVAAAIGGFAIVTASASMAVAAQTALPGDTLYPLKRTIENAHVSVQGASDDKGTTLLDNASGRLDEVDELSRSDSSEPTTIARTLDDFAEQATEASDLLLGDYAETGHTSSIAELRQFATDSLDELKALQDVVPDAARGSLLKAANILGEIDQQAASACPSCTDLPVVSSVPLASHPVSKMLKGLLHDEVTESSAPRDRTPRGRNSDRKGDDQSNTETDPPVNEPQQPLDETDNPPPVLPTGHDSTGPQDSGAPATIDAVTPGITGQHGHGTGTSGGGVGEILTDTGDALEHLLGGGVSTP